VPADLKALYATGGGPPFFYFEVENPMDRRSAATAAARSGSTRRNHSTCILPAPRQGRERDLSHGLVFVSENHLLLRALAAPARESTWTHRQTHAVVQRRPRRLTAAGPKPRCPKPVATLNEPGIARTCRVRVRKPPSASRISQSGACPN